MLQDETPVYQENVQEESDWQAAMDFRRQIYKKWKSTLSLHVPS